MTAPRLPRLAAALLLAGLGAACGRDKAPAGVLCQLPPPQPSALPTLPVAAGPGQSQAIHFGLKTTDESVTFPVPVGTASVTIVEQAASQAVPLTVRGGFSTAPNTPVPRSIDVTGGVGQIFYDVPMPPDTAFPVVDGITVLDPLAAPGLAVYFISSGAWTGALTLPNTSVAIPGTAAGDGVPAGDWTVRVNDWAAECRAFPFLGCSATTLTPSVYDVTVILKPAAASSSALKVVFYLVTSGGLTAANAPGDGRIQRLEWAARQVFAGAGITPAFEYRDVPIDLRLRYATGVDSNSTVCGGLGQLLQLAEPGNQLDVFLVDRIRGTIGGGTVVVGIDPIVPGPASFGGTPASGVVVSMENLSWVGPVPGCPPITPASTPSLATCGADITAAIVAHEAGHFLGLYHTTEGIGTIVDPIGDTATCFCKQCGAAPSQCQGLGQTDPQVASPYRMLVTDCLAPAGSVPECGGGDNLMFWLLDVDSKGLLTAGQAAVMRANPLVE